MEKNIGQIKDAALNMNIQDVIKKLNSNMGNKIIIGFIIFIIILGIMYFVYIFKYLNNRGCSLMGALYPTNDSYILPIDYTKPEAQYLLKDFYIKTAYNCCSTGSYKNDYVNLCALKNVIKQGVRGLDFEIYNIDNNPVVATSTVESNYVKETINSVNFSDVMTTIVNYAFSNSTAPNPTDPIILHLRIKSTNQNMLTNLGEIFKQYDKYLLNSHYSYEYTYSNTNAIDSNSSAIDSSANTVVSSQNNQYTHNLGNVKLTDLSGNKIIVIVDRINNAFMDNSVFYEYVNMTSNSVFMRALNFYNIKFTPDMNELITYNKQNMTIVMPDVNINPPNPSGIISRQMGCQLVAMRYQLFDVNLQESILFFDTAGSAFVLKPENLRLIPVTIPQTNPNPPELNFAARTVSTDYYSVQI